jgi:hypothetical protein
MSSRLVVAAFAIVASVIVGSCGGGGAKTTPELNGALSLIPAQGTLYAGIVYNFQILGGRPPYTLGSSEPVLLPVPARIESNSFQVVPSNPGVVDSGLTPEALQGRSVIVTVRDALGQQIATASTGGIFVAQNFLTGYGVFFTSNCAGQACSGSETIVRFSATINGVLYGNRQYRFCVVRGNFQFVVPETPSNNNALLQNCVDTVTDHTGTATVRLRVPADATTQLGTLRVIDVATGVYVDEVFTITQGSITGALTVLPNSFTFTGPRQGVCGTGSADFIVFDGDPPYTAVSSNPNVSVTPTTNSSNPARFTINAFNPNVCLETQVIVTDRNNRRATITVTTEEGSGTLPPLAVAPTTVNLNDTCGFSASVTAVGGVGPLSANSSHPRVSAVISGNTVTITRLAPDPASPPGPSFYPTTATVTITDGATIQSVQVSNVRQFCP